MKGYVKLRRGLLEHIKVMSFSELKVYIGLLLLANFKNGYVNITIGNLCDIIGTDYKNTLNSIHRLVKFGYVKFTPAKNQWKDSLFEITKYNGCGKNTEAIPQAIPEAPPQAIPQANDITSGNLKDLQNPKKSKEVIRTHKKLSQEDFLIALKINKAYSHINIDTELGKMDAWLLARPGRQKTKRFIINWLNKIEKPLPINKPKPTQLEYKAPPEEKRFNFVPNTKELIKKLSDKKGIY